MQIGEFHNNVATFYDYYNQRVRWIVVFIETQFRKFPIPVLNELRSAQDHIARCYADGVSDEEVEKQLHSAHSHLTRCLLDCYKFTWYEYGFVVSKKYFFAKLLGNISDINNGEFARQLAAKRKATLKSHIDARMSESTDKEKALDLYEQSIRLLVEIDEMYEDNIVAISWSIRKGVVIKLFLALGWVISACFVIRKHWDDIMTVWERIF